MKAASTDFVHLIYVRPALIMQQQQGSNGALEASRTSTASTASSLSSPARQPSPHIMTHEINNYMSDDNPDEVDINDTERNNAAAAVIALHKQDFLVSFLVDARGGSMKGCRYSGVKVSTIIDIGILLLFILNQWTDMADPAPVY